MRTSIGERRTTKCKRIAKEWKAAHKEAHRPRSWDKPVGKGTRRAYQRMQRKGREFYRSGCGSVLDLYPTVVD